MKKFTTFLLASLICFYANSFVYAETVLGNGGSSSVAVKGSYTEIGEAQTVYEIDISWGDMVFVYNAGDITETWDPETHTYVESVGQSAGWSCESGSNVITVKSRTNAELEVNITAEITAQGISAKINNSAFTLADASIGASTTVKGAQSSDSATLELSGELTDTSANNTAIGSITVTISQ